jgi:two-component system sensor histidine kinase BarA
VGFEQHASAVSDLEPELLELQDALEQVRQEAPRYLALTD